MTALSASDLNDAHLLDEVRSECARWEARDDLEAGSVRLFEVRDEALRRRLPLPMSCPMDTPPTIADTSA